MESAALPIRATGLGALLRLLVHRVLAALAAVLLELELARRRPLVLCRRVVPLFAVLALERDDGPVSDRHD